MKAHEQVRIYECIFIPNLIDFFLLGVDQRSVMPSASGEKLGDTDQTASDSSGLYCIDRESAHQGYAVIPFYGARTGL
jgi:hypothetical protein